MLHSWNTFIQARDIALAVRLFGVPSIDLHFRSIYAPYFRKIYYKTVPSIDLLNNTLSRSTIKQYPQLIYCTIPSVDLLLNSTLDWSTEQYPQLIYYKTVPSIDLQSYFSLILNKKILKTSLKAHILPTWTYLLARQSLRPPFVLAGKTSIL